MVNLHRKTSVPRVDMRSDLEETHTEGTNDGINQEKGEF